MDKLPDGPLKLTQPPRTTSLDTLMPERDTALGDCVILCDSIVN